MRNLIIGGFTNYGINQLKPWVLSAKEVAHNTDIVLVTGHASQETIDWLQQQGIIIVRMEDKPGIPIHVLRFLSIYDYLHNNQNKYRYVVTTDVKDVYFQKDPFEQIEDNQITLIVASEGLAYRNEPWGNENLMQTYGPYVYEQFKDNQILNVGTFGGEFEYVKDVIFHIFTNAINRPIPIVDQAVFNVLMNTQPFLDIRYTTWDWAAELGTVMDPSKIEHFRPHLLCDEPTVKDGLVYYGEKLFPIVHQYDRVPFLKDIVAKRYGQEDESQYFIYRT